MKKIKKIYGLKIGTGDNEKTLIDEFGAPTKEGMLAAGAGLLSVFGVLVVIKDILTLSVSRLIKKGKKKARKAKKIRTKAKNKALKLEAKLDRSALKQDLKDQTKLNKDMLKEVERLQKVIAENKIPENISWKWKLIRKYVLRERG